MITDGVGFRNFVLSDFLKQATAKFEKVVIFSALPKETFDENKNLITWEDFDAWIRISQITNKFHKVNKTIGYVWLGGGNELMGSKNSQILEQMYQNIIEILQKVKKNHYFWVMLFSFIAIPIEFL